MTRSPRDEEFSAFVQARRVELLRSACLLTAGDTHRAEDLVQTALARLYVAWPRVRRSGRQAIAYTWRIVVHAHIDEVRRPRWKREQYVAELPDEFGPGGPGDLGGFDVAWVNGAAVRAALAELRASDASGRGAAALAGLQRRGDRRPPELQRGDGQEPDGQRRGPAARIARRRR